MAESQPPTRPAFRPGPGWARRLAPLAGRPGRFTVAVLLAAGIAALDALTGDELGFFVFYFLPVALVAWNGSRREGVLASFACALLWYAAEAGHPAEFSRLWNTGIRLIAFVAIAALTARVGRMLERERQLNDELSQTIGRVHLLSGLLPICGSCKKIRNDEGYWERLEQYIEEHSAAVFSHGLCPDCAARFEAEPDDAEKDGTGI